MVAGGRGRWCGTSAARARSLLSRRARAATAAAAHVQRVIQREVVVRDSSVDAEALDRLHNREIRLWFHDGEIVEALLLGTDPREHADLTYEVRKVVSHGPPSARASVVGDTLIAPLRDLARFEELG